MFSTVENDSAPLVDTSIDENGEVIESVPTESLEQSQERELVTFTTSGTTNPNNIVFEQEFNKLIPTESTQISAIDKQSPIGTINIYAGTGENADLSNFAIRPFTISGDKPESSIHIGGNFQTVEGAFQAQKLVFSSMPDNEKEVVRKRLETASGSQARSIGRKIKDLNTVSWDKASSDVMRDLLLESFSQNPEALQRLLSTGNATLTHTQDKGKWGTEFPRILMEVRNELSQYSNEERTNNEFNNENEFPTDEMNHCIK